MFDGSEDAAQRDIDGTAHPKYYSNKRGERRQYRVSDIADELHNEVHEDLQST